MLSFLRAADPPRTNNATNNPIIYEKGRSAVNFRAPGSEFIMTHRIPPTTIEHGGSIVAPPHHYHVYQDEYFRVQSGIGNFYRGFDKTPFAVLSGSEGAQHTASVKAGEFHKFENASQAEDLVVDIHLTPESYENEQRFFRNFFGYLDDCRNTNRAPNLFQLLVMLHSADTPVAIPMPWGWLSRLVSRLFTAGGALIGRWLLGFRASYPEYYDEAKTSPLGVMTAASWTSIPWAAVPGDTTVESEASILGWHKRRVPYAGEDSTYLQTVDIWVPASGVNPSAPLDANTLPQRPGPWLVYIHGGAWRDPLVDSSSFDKVAIGLLKAAVGSEAIPVAGIASLNYRLSPHPSHSTNPSPPQDAETPLDNARTAQHPEHIRDVLTGLSFLQDLGAANNYILAGHSCGATLAFQAAMNPSRWKAADIPFKKPRALVGLNGLYDLTAFIRHPDESHKALVALYEVFTRGAFGEDEKVWEAVCPTAINDWQAEWPEGERVFLVQSKSDSLVPYSQLEIMRQCLRNSPGLALTVAEMPATGDHNELWQHREELLNILKNVLVY